MPEHEKINYVEFPARDLRATKSFFQTVFGWSFVDYGPAYTAFPGVRRFHFTEPSGNEFAVWSGTDT
jgi:predicted enzyme related to lactoylglutathione lyase